MKNRWLRYFWTELGRRAVESGSRPSVPPAGMPEALTAALSAPTPVIEPDSCQGPFLGSMLDARRSRRIYSMTWDVLREAGFSRPFRMDPWPDVTLLIPFSRDGVCVLPQSFASRIPPRERALSVVGRSIACSLLDHRLVTVLGRWDDGILAVLSAGGVVCTSMDRLSETVHRCLDPAGSTLDEEGNSPPGTPS